jgi:F0F1-type ATP synthase membrane subunit c/vacuolar-type H+-ATPase subunit K
MSDLAQSGYVPQVNSLPTSGKAFQIAVPAALIARSHPCGHSVPIVARRHKLARPHPWRNIAVAGLVAVVAVIGLVKAVDLSMQAHEPAGQHLVCRIEGFGKYEGTVCRWQ